MVPYIMSDNMTCKREKSTGKSHSFIFEVPKLTVLEHLCERLFHMFNLKTAQLSIADRYNQSTTSQTIICQFEKCVYFINHVTSRDYKNQKHCERFQ